jgi:hypothetical protein
MYREFDNLESLMTEVQQDKDPKGANASTYLRYPIRFVLFDNFSDLYAFVTQLLTDIKQIKHVGVQKWMDSKYPDIMMLHSELYDRIKEYVHSLHGESAVITPFSELARFYENDRIKEFDTLIRTLSSIETDDEGWNRRQRIYIPLVGLHGKMSNFHEDQTTQIWYQSSKDKDANYRLVITNGTQFEVKNAEQRFVVIKDVKHWLDLWRNRDTGGRKEILCTSPSIYVNACNANPDNAFTYCEVKNVYEFIVRGLKIDSIPFIYKEEEEKHWAKLASLIDLSKHFDFNEFLGNYFSVISVANKECFIKQWLERDDEFSRWLLVNSYRVQGTAFLQKALLKLKAYTDLELCSCMALELPTTEDERDERMYCMNEMAHRSSVTLTSEVELKYSKKLAQYAVSHGYREAIKLFTALSMKEKEQAIAWYAKGLITRDDFYPFYPDMYYYLDTSIGTTDPHQQWVLKYFDEYKRAKIQDRYTKEIAGMVEEYNGDATHFSKWKNMFKTVPTCLSNRTDIDMYYWIDGLGVDWIPFIAHLIENAASTTVYLNETQIACSALPTVTGVNRPILEKLAKDGKLHKCGDIDKMAHQPCDNYTTGIVQEIEAVRRAITHIIYRYAGKKVAIVSDHGLSYLSHTQQGLNLAGVESHHFGRYATAKGEVTKDKNYFVLEDKKTLCALNHQSLCAKIPSNAGAHGGCTPEEVLVPILIISASPNAVMWKATWLDEQIAANNPILHLRITGLSSTDSPKIRYNKAVYNLISNGNDSFISEPIDLKNDITLFELCIGECVESKYLIVNTGTKEEDLFADFGI